METPSSIDSSEDPTVNDPELIMEVDEAPPEVWFTVVNSNLPLTQAPLQNVFHVGHLRVAIKNKYSNFLQKYDRAQLILKVKRLNKNKEDEENLTELSNPSQSLFEIIQQFRVDIPATEKEKGVLTADEIRKIFARNFELLVILPSSLLTEAEYLSFIPPFLGYIEDAEIKPENIELISDEAGPSNRASGSGSEKKSISTKSSYALKPDVVRRWKSFKNDVKKMTFDNKEKKYEKPIFIDYKNVPSESKVREAYNVNVLGNLDEIMNSRYPNEEFNDVEALNNVIGKPDIIRRCHSVLLLIIEMKTRWVIHGDTNEANLVELYISAYADKKKCRYSTNGSSVIRSIEQTYGYMYYNKLKYGALSTYDLTWFFRLSKKDILYISDPIKIDSTTPTLFQCLVYLMSRGRVHPRPPPPQRPHFLPRPNLPSPDNSDSDDSADNEDTHNDRPQRCLRPRNLPNPERSKENKGRKSGKSGESGESEKKNSVTAGDNHSEKQPEIIKVRPLCLDEFDIICFLGSGRSGTVFKAYWYGEEVALKLCDIAQQPEYEEELITEVEVYNNLKDLQGCYIPRLRTAGSDGVLFFMLATENVGSPINVDQLNYTERQKIVEALSEIHRSGYVHNDIREENILIQRGDDGSRVSFIDFAFSKREPSKRLRLKEMAELKCLLGLEEEKVIPQKRPPIKKERQQRKRDPTKNSPQKRSTESPRKVRVLRSRIVHLM